MSENSPSSTKPEAEALTQPPPTVGKEDVFPRLEAELHRLLPQWMDQRRQKGLKTYGTLLQTFNGRRPLKDKLEELLDAMVYTMQDELEATELRHRNALLTIQLEETTKALSAEEARHRTYVNAVDHDRKRAARLASENGDANRRFDKVAGQLRDIATAFGIPDGTEIADGQVASYAKELLHANRKRASILDKINNEVGGPEDANPEDVHRLVQRDRLEMAKRTRLLEEARAEAATHKAHAEGLLLKYEADHRAICDAMGWGHALHGKNLPVPNSGVLELIKQLETKAKAAEDHLSDRIRRDERIVQQEDELAKLRAFKQYVHERLDVAGVLQNPDGPHSKEGCRIGDRMDILFRELHRVRTLAGTYEDRIAKYEEQRKTTIKALGLGEVP